MANHNLTQSSMSKLHPIIVEAIKDGGQFVFYPSGMSMYPTICEKKDCVVLIEAKNLKKNDLILYLRDNGAYVLHRILKINNGKYTLCGDNQYVIEHGVKHESIIAMASEIRKPDGKVQNLDTIRAYKPSAKQNVGRFLRSSRTLLGKIFRFVFKR